jgi:hypothetical protein
MLTVVTSFSPEGFEQYGRACVESIQAYWPNSAQLLCYWEGEKPDGVEGFDLLQIEPCKSFLGRHRGNPVFAGQAEDPRWRWGPKARRKGYSFRHDAYKFARKVFAVAHAAREVESGKLFWLDADTLTGTPVNGIFLNGVLPDDVSLSYLARHNYHSELGFVGYNLDLIQTRAFLTVYEGVYSEDRFTNYPAWDDCSVFDQLVSALKPEVKHIHHTSRAQPFDNSILGRYMTHLKGDRKFGGAGKSEGEDDD